MTQTQSWWTQSNIIFKSRSRKYWGKCFKWVFCWVMVGIKSDQRIIFFSTKLQLIPLFCLKQHRRFFYPQKKSTVSHELVQQCRPSLILLPLSLLNPPRLLPSPVTLSLLTPCLKNSVLFFSPFSGVAFIYSSPCLLLLYSVSIRMISWRSFICSDWQIIALLTYMVLPLVIFFPFCYKDLVFFPPEVHKNTLVKWFPITFYHLCFMIRSGISLFALFILYLLAA